MNELLDMLSDLHEDVDFESCDTLIDDGILDSFDIVTLITQIKDEFAVTIPADEIVPDTSSSAGAIWNLIRRLDEE